ncbi:response regulator, partial [Klebsiella pneumoniae]|uniref:response regulator n=2 Tax=Klebsiella pneumoniae TaxID=573 RepID=UPI001D0D880C
MNKIVFVEDDPEVGTLIAAYLGKHDMDVVVEPRGDRAEEVIAREKPDLVLLDIMLPGKDGMTLCRDLRGQWQGPIVLLTGTVAKLAMRQPFVLFKGLTFQKLCL